MQTSNFRQAASYDIGAVQKTLLEYLTCFTRRRRTTRRCLALKKLEVYSEMPSFLEAF